MMEASNQEQHMELGRTKPINGSRFFGAPEILASIFSLIAAIFAGFSVNLVSDLIAPQIPVLVIVALSIVFGVIIILYAAVVLYRRQAKTRQLAISKLKETEKEFFAKVDNTFSALLAEEVR